MQMICQYIKDVFINWTKRNKCLKKGSLLNKCLYAVLFLGLLKHKHYIYTVYIPYER